MSGAAKAPWGTLNRLFWAASDRTSLRFKIMGIVVGFVMVLGIGVTFQVRRSMTGTLSRELDKEGVSIARDVAARSTDLLLTNNTFALYEMVKDTLANNEDLRYVFIQDASGQIVVHTFEGGFPTQLSRANSVSGDERARIQLLRTEEGFIRDVAVPIFEGRSGTARIGLSEGRLERAVSAITRQLLGATVAVSVVGIAAAYFLTWVLTRPILDMVRVTRAVTRGDLGQRVSGWFARDEIGQLGSAFNSMIDNLEQSQVKLAEFGRFMVRRNEELTALFAVASTVNQSLDLQRILDDSLQRVMELAGFCCGEVLIYDREKSRLLPRAARARTPGLALEPREFALGEGLPGRVAELETTLIVPGAEYDPRVSDGSSGCRPSMVIGIPLMAKNRLMGVMNFFYGGDAQPPIETIELMSSIGQQIGVAIENATLWEELRRKEESRAHLLEKVISAQEEERKRIARELHDQTSQALTSLMVGLKVIEETSSLELVRERTAELRALAAQTLEEVHDLALELRPSVLDDLGLVAALERYVKESCPKMGLTVDLHISGLERRRLGPEIETTVYRIVQEALTNVAKHAEARNACVVLEHRNSHLVTIIEDDGRGFCVSETVGATGHERKLGLFGMYERATLIGGELTIESTPGTGTSIYLKVPLRQVGVL